MTRDQLSALARQVDCILADLPRDQADAIAAMLGVLLREIDRLAAGNEAKALRIREWEIASVVSLRVRMKHEDEFPSGRATIGPEGIEALLRRKRR